MDDRLSFCRICSRILGVKYRRCIFSRAFLVVSELQEVLGYDPVIGDGLPSYICRVCYARLTRIQTVTKLIATKLDSLKEERRNLISDLKSKISQNELSPGSVVFRIQQEIQPTKSIVIQPTKSAVTTKAVIPIAIQPNIQLTQSPVTTKAVIPTAIQPNIQLTKSAVTTKTVVPIAIQPDIRPIQSAVTTKAVVPIAIQPVIQPTQLSVTTKGVVPFAIQSEIQPTQSAVTTKAVVPFAIQPDIQPTKNFTVSLLKENKVGIRTCII
ncbi:hypothetical protein SNE40_004911 [Patella caerulea]|uniref:ZAD domain-containing protein n=1 Tax=Patella caerulea TaxID=87958 RepID=A0AAN8K3Z2_PATCE